MKSGTCLTQKTFTRHGAGVRFSLFLCLFSYAAFLAAAFEPSEQDIRDAILGTKTFTQDQLRAMDLNTDGKVDVADLVYKVSDGEPMLVSFKESMSTAYESEGVVSIPLVYTAGFTGSVSYVVSGSAVAGMDFGALPGTIMLDGTGNTAITVSLIDDLHITVDDEKGPVSRYIVFDLKANNDKLYEPSFITSHTLIIQDNDAYWNGIIEDLYAARQFRLAVCRNNSQVEVMLHSNGSGPFLEGEWPASVSESGGLLVLRFGPIDVPANQTTADVAFKRELELQLPDNIGSAEIQLVTGVAFDKILSPAHAHLKRETGAKVTLVRSFQDMNLPLPELYLEYELVRE